MLLVCDVGNTNVVFAIYDGDKRLGRWRIATDPQRTGDQYAVWLLQLMTIAGIEREAIAQIIFGSVVPRADHNVTVLAEKYFGITPLQAGYGAASWPFEIDVEQPSSLGADRALNVLAAHEKFGGDLIVADFGTATKFELVDYSGTYKGGIITPGVNLSLGALVGKTAKLPRIAIREPESETVIGRTTEDQMLIGVFWGHLAMVEGLIGRMKAEIGRPAKVVATGGLGLLFDTHTELFDHIEPDLTLEGLVSLARHAADHA